MAAASSSSSSRKSSSRSSSSRRKSSSVASTGSRSAPKPPLAPSKAAMAELESEHAILTKRFAALKTLQAGNAYLAAENTALAAQLATLPPLPPPPRSTSASAGGEGDYPEFPKGVVPGDPEASAAAVTRPVAREALGSFAGRKWRWGRRDSDPELVGEVADRGAALLKAARMARLAVDMDPDRREGVAALGTSVTPHELPALTSVIEEWRTREGTIPVAAVVGPPGCGKTSWLASWLTSTNAQVASVWVPKAGDASAWSAKAVAGIVRVLAEMGVSANDKVTSALTEAARDNTVCWRRAVSALPAKVDGLGTGSVVIVVDAVEGASAGLKDQAISAAIAATASSGLPPWLRVLITMRPDEDVMERVLGASSGRLACFGFPRLPHTYQAESDLDWSAVMERVCGPPTGNPLLELLKPALAMFVAAGSGGIPKHLLQHVLSAGQGSMNAESVLSKLSQVLVVRYGEPEEHVVRKPASSPEGEANAVAAAAAAAANSGIELSPPSPGSPEEKKQQSNDVVVERLVTLSNAPGDSRIVLCSPSLREWLTIHMLMPDLEEASGGSLVSDASVALAKVALDGLYPDIRPWADWARVNAVQLVLAVPPDHPDREALLRDLHLHVIMSWEWMLGRFLQAGGNEHHRGLDAVLGDLSVLEKRGWEGGRREVGAMRRVWTRWSEGPQDVTAVADMMSGVFCRSTSEGAMMLCSELSGLRPLGYVGGAGTGGTAWSCIDSIVKFPRRIFSLKPLGKDRIVFGQEKDIAVFDVDKKKMMAMMSGHDSEINCVDVLPNGNIVSGSDDNSWREWDGKTFTCLGNYVGHTQRVWCVLPISDTRVITASEDHHLLEWHLELNPARKWNQGRRMEGHTSTVLCAIAADLPGSAHYGTRILSCGDDNTIRAWTVRTGLPISVLQSHTAGVKCMALLGDGSLVSGSRDRSIRIWSRSWETEKTVDRPIGMLVGHSACVRSITVLQDGTTVVSGGEDYVIRMWDSRTGICLARLSGSSDQVWGISALADHRLLSISHDGKAMWWSPDEYLTPPEMLAAVKSAPALAFKPAAGNTQGGPSTSASARSRSSSKGRRRTSSKGGTPTVPAAPNLIGLASPPPASAPVSAPAGGGAEGGAPATPPAPTGAAALNATAGAAGAEPGAEPTGAPEEPEPPGGDLFESLHQLLVAAAAGGLPEEAAPKAHPIPKGPVAGHREVVMSLAVLDDGRIVSGSLDRSIILWAGLSGEFLCELPGHGERVMCLMTIPGDTSIGEGPQRIVSGGGDCRVRVWAERNGSWNGIKVLSGHGEEVNEVVLMPGSSVKNPTLVSASDDNTLRVWAVDDPEPEVRVMNAGDKVLSVDAVDEVRVVSGGRDNTVRVWNITSGECERLLNGSTSFVWSVQMMRDTGFAMSGSADRVIRIWDLSKGNAEGTESGLVMSLNGHTSNLDDVIDLGGGYLLSGAMDRTLRVWNWKTGKEVGRVDLDAPVRAMVWDEKNEVVLVGQNEEWVAWRWSGKGLEPEGLNASPRQAPTNTNNAIPLGGDGCSLM